MTARAAKADRSTLTSLLVDAAERAAPGEGVRIVDRRERAELFEWADIARGATEVGRRLDALGVGKNDRVALVYPTSIDFLYAFFGALSIGAVPAPLYPPVRLGRLDEYHPRTAGMIRSAGAVALLVDGRVRKIVGETVELARPRLGCHRIEELPHPSPPRSIEIGPDDLAFVQFSSGTTVEPKPVALSHRAVVAQVEALNGFWPDSESVRHSGVSWLPLYHDMGLIGCIFTALERQATITLLPPEAFVVRPAIWLRTLSRFGATISPAPNFAYGLAVDKIRDGELEGVDLSTWRVALNGAEAVAPSVLRAFADRFAGWGFRPEALTPVYGLSEASLAVTFSPVESAFRSVRFDRESLIRDQRAVPGIDGREIVSVGRPLPGFEIQIRTEERAIAAPGRIGRLWVRGPSLMDGYLGRPDETARALVDGWLDTGDRGFVHDGELFLTGRVKDLLILRGRNYAPDGIEQATDRVAGARPGCSVAVSHLAEGADREELWLFVERARRPELGDEEIAKGCRESVRSATELDPDAIVVVAPGTLPRTSSGKLRRAETLRRYLAGELLPPESMGPLKMVWAIHRSRRAMRRAERERGS